MVRLKYDQVFERVGALPELATVSHSLTGILSITRDPNATAKDLAALISKDPALSMKILRTVNSCFYGFERSIENIEDAIVLLGFGEVERLALAMSVVGRFAAKKTAFDLNLLWLHCLVSAIAADATVKAYGVQLDDTSDVYAAALLHDIGKAVMAQAVPEAIASILYLMEDKAVTMYEAEMEILDGATHCVTGAWVAEQWGLPMTIIQSIQMHHTPQEVPGDNRLVGIINLADSACYHVGFPAVKINGQPPTAKPASFASLPDPKPFITEFRRLYEEKRKQLDAILT